MTYGTSYIRNESSFTPMNQLIICIKFNTSGRNFSGKNLHKADFTNCDLSEANLSGTNFTTEYQFSCKNSAAKIMLSKILKTDGFHN